MLSLRSTASTVAPEEQAPPSSQARPERAPRRRLWFFPALGALFAGIGLAAVLGGGHVTAEVRSGSPGYRSTPSGKQIHWGKKAVTVYLDSSLKKLGNGADEAVMQAFGQWVLSDPRLPDLAFDTGKTSAQPKQDGMSTVSYGKIQVPGHERDVAITVTYSNDKSGEILEADVILNAAYPMATLLARAKHDEHGANKGDDRGSNKSNSADESMDCQNRYDAQNVVTHEAGHFFGLGEDLVERSATMFLSIDQCETHKRALSLTDTQAISTLYAQNADSSEEPKTAAARGCSFGAAPGTAPTGALALILGLSLLRRRRPR
jgi:MYXO-CTERM domain-containing protein